MQVQEQHQEVTWMLGGTLQLVSQAKAGTGTLYSILKGLWV